jgi:hypothetical protein
MAGEGKDGPQQEAGAVDDQPQVHASSEGLTAAMGEEGEKVKSQSVMIEKDVKAARNGGPEGKARMSRRQADARRASEGMIDRSLQAQLGRQLRAIYSGVEEEAVPERFIILLEALERKEKRR